MLFTGTACCTFTSIVHLATVYQYCSSRLRVVSGTFIVGYYSTIHQFFFFNSSLSLGILFLQFFLHSFSFSENSSWAMQ